MRKKMYTFCVVNIERLRIQIDLKICYFSIVVLDLKVYETIVENSIKFVFVD